jgi:hypothetical protein
MLPNLESVVALRTQTLDRTAFPVQLPAVYDISPTSWTGIDTPALSTYP